MMADRAAHGRAGDRVVAGNMAENAARGSTRRTPGPCRQRRSHGSGEKCAGAQLVKTRVHLNLHPSKISLSMCQRLQTSVADAGRLLHLSHKLGLATPVIVGLTRWLRHLRCPRRGAVALRLLMRHVVPHRAAYGSAGQAVMPSNMACNTSDNRTLDATRLSGNRCCKQGGTQRHSAGQTPNIGHTNRILSESRLSAPGNAA
jgi:hypothetical protein